jgi:uncharacterized metal-binding protein
MAAEQLALTVLAGVLLVGIVALVSRRENWRGYTPLGSGAGYGGEAGHGHSEKPAGLIRWFTTVDHKDIGIMYGLYATVAFLWGGAAVFLMRIELAAPGFDIMQAQFYNSLLTSHGITMLFLFGTPIIAAFANYFVPLLIGADDMAFPRINAIAFWLLPPGALLIWAGFFPLGDVIPAQTAWTLYTPLSLGKSGAQANAGVALLLLGLHLTGVSATMGAINFVATILTERFRRARLGAEANAVRDNAFSERGRTPSPMTDYDDLPLVYSCSGCSSAAQMANDLAVRLDCEREAEMSCIAGVGGDVGPLVDTATSGRPMLVVDGCPLECARKSLAQHDVTPDRHVNLAERGVDAA